LKSDGNPRKLDLRLASRKNKRSDPAGIKEAPSRTWYFRSNDQEMMTRFVFFCLR
jgi:hypothetical protein